ncbi:MOSC domain-containing protein [Candidatus Epulonipiscium viviparus]|nr:MOSC domain-containing protein [Candidatus Epulopiscium viviparus]
MGKIVNLCISENRGTKKTSVAEVEFVEDYGIKNDAHAGDWHRQVSLLDVAKIEEFKRKGINISAGDFGENVITEGIDFKQYRVGTLFKINNAILEITQYGKECHTRCEIFDQTGECIMPTEGVFAKVIESGTVAVGDEIVEYKPLTVAILTASDACSRNERADMSGEAVREIVEYEGFKVVDKVVVADEIALISAQLKKWCDETKVDLIITTGGTGFSVRDVTPEATLAVIERQAPGITEAMRAESLQVTPKAMLSRAVAGIRGLTIIVNVPGSVKAVRENLMAIIATLPHGIAILKGSVKNCGEA